MRFFEREREERAGNEAIHAALQEWKNAVTYFESVNDPELIDYAAFGIEAARRKYVFLLKHNGGTKN